VERKRIDKNEVKEFHYSMENVESQRIWMHSLEIEFSLPTCGKQEGWVWTRYYFM